MKFKMIDLVTNSEIRSKISIEKITREMKRESIKFMGGKKN